MPTFKIEQISPDISLGIWKIEESIDTLFMNARLSSHELTEYEKYTHPKRKKEWLGARNMLNTLINHCGYDYFGLKKGRLNKPLLRNNAAHVSLAHSFPYAVALIHKTSPCGIDIEKAKPALIQISPRYLNPAELSFTREDLDSLCLAWAAKESLYKMYGEDGLSFRNNMILEPFVPGNDGYIKARVSMGDLSRRHTLAFRKIDGFFVCFSCQ